MLLWLYCWCAILYVISSAWVTTCTGIHSWSINNTVSFYPVPEPPSPPTPPDSYKRSISITKTYTSIVWISHISYSYLCCTCSLLYGWNHRNTTWTWKGLEDAIFFINFDKACFIVLYKCPTIAQNVFKPPNKKLFMCKITVIWVYKFENVKLFWHLEFAVENFSLEFLKDLTFSSVVTWFFWTAAEIWGWKYQKLVICHPKWCLAQILIMMACGLSTHG